MLPGMPEKSRLRFDLYPPPELVEAIDRYRARLPGVPPRAVAARLLLEEVLQEKGLLKGAKAPRATAAR